MIYNIFMIFNPEVLAIYWLKILIFSGYSKYIELISLILLISHRSNLIYGFLFLKVAFKSLK